MKKFLAFPLILCLSACAKATAIPVSQNMVRITTDAVQACGATGAQDVASRQAAIETIRRGFDGYVILSGEHDKTTGYSFNAYGGSTQTQHHQSLVVKMFRDGEPGSEAAIPARQQFGRIRKGRCHGEDHRQADHSA